MSDVLSLSQGVGDCKCRIVWGDVSFLVSLFLSLTCVRQKILFYVCRVRVRVEPPIRLEAQVPLVHVLLQEVGVGLRQDNHPRQLNTVIAQNTFHILFGVPSSKFPIYPWSGIFSTHTWLPQSCSWLARLRRKGRHRRNAPHDGGSPESEKRAAGLRACPPGAP